MKYFRIWKKLASCAIQSTLSNRVDSFGYLLGKLVRFGFFLLMIVSLFNHTDTLLGYTKYEVLLFYATFGILDVLPQIFFRGIYWFREDILKGSFDFVLVRPVRPLFYTLSRFTDLLDLLFLLPILCLFTYVVFQLRLEISFVNTVLYVLFLLLGFLVTVGIHIISAAMTVRTLDSGNFIWFYRGALGAAAFPPEVMPQVFQMFFTFVMPVVLIVSFPSKLLLGRLSLEWGMIGVVFSFLFFGFSLWLWKRNLRFYSSASS